MSNDTGRLAGKVALVTGAGSQPGPGVGNGKAIASLMARHGARVCLADIELGHALETLEIIQADGGEAFAVAGDVSSVQDSRRIVTETVERFGRLDVLVNNVGIGGQLPVVEVDESSWDHTLAVNLRGTFLMCKSAIPHMIEGGGGAIVNIASVAGIGSIGGSGYGASKGGMIMLTRDIAVDYGRQGIRANVVAPGSIATPQTSPWSEEKRTQRRKLAPLGIQGQPDDIAWAVLFLASDEARFVSGVTLPVDGGMLITLPMRAVLLLDD